MNNAAEILRQLHNMIRIGTVAELDHAQARVRIETGDNLTDWLPWRTTRAGETTTWDPPTIGEQVLLLAPSGDLAQAVIFPGIYSENNPAPSSDKNLWLRKFPDGSILQYDHAAHLLTIDIKGDVFIKTEGNLTAEVAGNLSADVTGNLNADVEGNAELQAGGVAKIDAAQVKLNGGTGVVTGAHICAYTGAPHADFSKTVTAGA